MTLLRPRSSARRTARLVLSGALLAVALPLSLAPAASASSPVTADPVPPVPGVTDTDLDLTPGTQWYAGGASNSINPTKAMLDTGAFYLGGFGFGSGKTVISQLNPDAPTYDSGRSATGVLPDKYGASTRAMALGDGKHAIVTAQIETQGYFLAYKAGDYGIVDIRRAAAAKIAALRAQNPALGNALPARAIVVDSNHTHSGPDTAGVWGGVPESYLQLVKDRTVDAIVRAWQSLQPVDLFYGVKKAGVAGKAYYYDEPDFDRLMTNQYADDPQNQVVDDEVRVLQGRDRTTGKPVLTYVNFSAHADVLGSDNTLVSGDYTGPLSELLAKDGGVGFAQVATLGREQPNRGSCAKPAASGQPQMACLDGYAARVNARAQAALADAKPVTGPKLVALSSYFLTDAADNALIVGLDYGGFAAGAPLMRSQTPPWFTGDVLGTTMFSGRIGNLVISGNPGEAYPQILQRVRDGLPGKQGYFSIGTAGDFLGYIIYPFGAYPEPIRRTILDGKPFDVPDEVPPSTSSCSGVPSPVGCPNPIGNDNFFFNVSQTFGQRLVCAELRGAKENFPEDDINVTSVEPACAAFTADGAIPAGFDTKFSSTGVGPTDAPGSEVPEAPYAALLLLTGLAVGGAVVSRRRAA